VRATRNPATLRGLLRANGIAPIEGLRNQLPKEFVPNSDIALYVPQDGDYEWLYSLTPRYLQRSARDEIVGELFLELVERRVDRAGVPACAKRMIAAYNKENPMKAYGDIRTPLPLDAPAFLDGTMSLAEIASQGLWG
jgi:hypothetical protein